MSFSYCGVGRKKITGPHFYSDFNKLCEEDFDVNDFSFDEKKIFENIIVFQNGVLDSYMNYDPEVIEEKQFPWLFGDKKLGVLVLELKLLLLDWMTNKYLSEMTLRRWQTLVVHEKW